MISTGEPHVSDIIEKQRGFFDDGGDWPELKRRIIARLTAHQADEHAARRGTTARSCKR